MLIVFAWLPPYAAFTGCGIWPFAATSDVVPTETCIKVTELTKAYSKGRVWSITTRLGRRFGVRNGGVGQRGQLRVADVTLHDVIDR